VFILQEKNLNKDTYKNHLKSRQEKRKKKPDAIPEAEQKKTIVGGGGEISLCLGKRKRPVKRPKGGS